MQITEYVNVHKKTGLSILCAVALCLCIGILAPHFSNAATYQHLTDRLDEKRETAIEVSAVLAGASVAIAAVPGDATTPIADQIASMNSYLIVVIGAIMLEKYLLPLIGMLVFFVLFPVALLLCIMFIHLQKRLLLQSALLLAILGISLLLVIPTGILIGEKVDTLYGLSTLSDTIQHDLKELEAGSATDSAALRDTQNNNGSPLDGLSDRILGFLSDQAETITSDAAVQLEKIKVILGDLLDAIAALIVSTCIIPILTFFLFFWIVKLLCAVAVKWLERQYKE